MNCPPVCFASVQTAISRNMFISTDKLFRHQRRENHTKPRTIISTEREIATAKHVDRGVLYSN